MRYRLAAGLAVLGLAACASPDPAVLANHIVVADEEGCLVDPFAGVPVAGGCAACVPDLLTVADAACDAASQRSGQDRPRPRRRLLIHVHGGLKTVDSSLLDAQGAVQDMAAEEWADWHYPVFLVWPSGLGSTLTDHLLHVRQGQHWTYLGPPTAPLVLTADIASGVARAPKNLLYTWLLDLGTGLEVLGVRRRWRLPTWANADAAFESAKSLGYHVSKGRYRRGLWAQAGRFLAYWATFPLKALTEVVLLDGMGGGGWNVMLRRTRSVFHPPAEFQEHADATPAERRAIMQQDATGAFAEFLRLLRDHVRSQPADYEITLVGHSMGAIVCNDILRTYGRDLPFRRIVYMAPACSVKDAVDVVLPLLRESRDHDIADQRLQFHVLTLHPLADADEAQWGWLDIVPRGSLLEWIDNWYTHPETMIDRVLGKWANVMPALHLLHEVRDQVHVKAFDCVPGSRPTRHGEFNRCAFWRRSFWTVEPDHD